MTKSLTISERLKILSKVDCDKPQVSVCNGKAHPLLPVQYLNSEKVHS